MYEKILQAIRTKYSNLGLSNEILEGLARQLAGFVKEETEIEAAVGGVETTLKMIQSFGDKRATSEAERLKKEYEGKKAPEKKEETEDVPAWGKSILDGYKTLQEKLDGIYAKETSNSLSQKLSSILSEKKVPESFSKIALVGRTFKDEAEVLALADTVATQFDVFKQDSVNSGFSYTEPPAAGIPPKKDSDEIANMINAGTKEIVESQKTN